MTSESANNIRRIFTEQTAPLTKLPLLFYSPIFPFSPSSRIFTSLLFFNQIFSLEKEEAKNRGKNLSQKLGGRGNQSLKLGGSCARFRFQIWGQKPLTLTLNSQDSAATVLK